MVPKESQLQQQIGQLLMIGFDGAELSSSLVSLLTRIQPAGVILFARNIESASQTHRLLRDCQSQVKEPLLTALDLEGGGVDRFRTVFGPTPSPAEVFATRDAKLFRGHGEIIGKMCAGLGFSVDLAPALDLAFEASQKVMGSRLVSDDPEEVILYAREFLGGLQTTGVIGAGKHFPGLGEGTLDSHFELPVIEKSFTRLWREDLVPYRKLRRELPLILVNHANYPLVTRDRRPASLSRYWITTVLRQRIGYRGLILSDDMEMAGVLKATPIEEAAVEFVRAGGDLCLVCRQQEKVEGAFDALCKTVARDPRFRRRVLESAKHIVSFKKKAAGLKRRAIAPSSERIRRLSTQLWEFSERVRLQSLSKGAAAGARG